MFINTPFSNKCSNFFNSDDFILFVSPGDTNSERMQFTLTADVVVFDVRGCSDVWVAIFQVPGDIFQLRLATYVERTLILLNLILFDVIII